MIRTCLLSRHPVAVQHRNRQTELTGQSPHRRQRSRGNLVRHEAQPRQRAQLHRSTKNRLRTQELPKERLVRLGEGEVADQLVLADRRERTQSLQLLIGEHPRCHLPAPLATDFTRLVQRATGCTTTGQVRGYSVGFSARTTGTRRGGDARVVPPGPHPRAGVVGKVAAEKDTLRQLLTGWLAEYSIPVLVVRGFGSQSYADVVRDRARSDTRPAALLYLVRLRRQRLRHRTRLGAAHRLLGAG